MGKAATVTFAVRIPNAVTRAAIAELEARGGERFEAGTGAAFRRILGKHKKSARA